ncbi:hypothetical protein FACS1894133_3460 [Clostridia bacterium]|nr:hypothetical protein FACS1894133_3460 [Clostridia bacterium]
MKLIVTILIVAVTAVAATACGTAKPDSGVNDTSAGYTVTTAASDMSDTTVGINETTPAISKTTSDTPEIPAPAKFTTVSATFAPPGGVTPSRDELDEAKARIETRLSAKNITGYDIYTDYVDNRIFVRFPGKSGDTLAKYKSAAKELAETAELTFREGGSVSDTDTAQFPLILSGEDVESASPRTENDGGYSRYTVMIKLNEKGKEAFKTATTRLANTGTPVSIWLDNNCISAPVVNVPITDGNLNITGNFTTEDVTALADKINSGALPFKLVMTEFDVES